MTTHSETFSWTSVTADFGLEQPYLPYLEAAFMACDGASAILKHHFGHLHSVAEKFQAGLVSEADQNSEKFIVDLLRSRFPDHSFLGEESGLSEGARERQNEALWMIDPLDGTTNYVHQFPFFCISIGLELKGEMVAAVVDAPLLGMRFYALKGGGAFMNGRHLQVSPRLAFRDGLFATGFSSYDETLQDQLDLITKIIREARGIRRAGAAALDLCFVAQGAYDVFWERNLQPWDTAAGILIAKEAGAVVTDMSGASFNPRLKSVLVGSPFMHSEILKCMLQFKSAVKS